MGCRPIFWYDDRTLAALMAMITKLDRSSYSLEDCCDKISRIYSGVGIGGAGGGGGGGGHWPHQYSERGGGGAWPLQYSEKACSPPPLPACMNSANCICNKLSN